jgi:hypothetical protein
MRTGRGDAAQSGELNEGRDGWHGLRDADPRVRADGLASGLAEVHAPGLLDPG